MKIRQIPFLLLIINISVFTGVEAQQKESMDSLMLLYEKEHCFNGEILVQESNKISYHKCVGYRDNEKQEKLQPNSMFNLASVSKPFTAIAILQLQEKKLLNINDPVDRYISTFPYKNVCIKHLLSHTSGIAGNFDFLDETDRQKQLSNDSIPGILLKYHPDLLFDPGSHWSYNNVGYDILAIVVEKVTQMQFSEYMAKYIFRPAGMTRTFVPQTADISKWLPKKCTEKDIALPHNFKDLLSCEVHSIYYDVITSKEYYYGSTNVYSTVSDLVRFDKALNSGKILGKTFLELAYTPFRLNDGTLATDSLAPIPSYYGLGWDIAIDRSNGRIIWHKGRSGGTRAVFIRNIDKKQIVAVLDNNDNWGTDLKAIACYRIIHQQSYRHPVNESLVQKLGCDIRSKGFEEAKKLFNERIAKERQNYFISKNEMMGLATALSIDHKTNDAFSVMELCNELYPGDWNVLITTADLLLQENQVDSAAVCYQRAVRLYSEQETEQLLLLGSIGEQFFISGRLNDAELVLKLNTELFPSDANSYDNYAFILDQNNKLDLAIAAEEKAVELARSQNNELLQTLQENLVALKAKK